MKALVLQGPGQIARQDVPDPVVKDADDAVIRFAAVVIEAVGVHEAFDMCTRMVRPGGRVATPGGPQHNEIIAPAQP